MQTRRVFIKTLLALGAVILPWSILPDRLKELIKIGLGHPPVELVLPNKPKQNAVVSTPKANAEILNYTAMDDIRTLSAPELQGRRAGTVGEAKAAEYLTSQLEKLGLQPMGDPQTGFIHAFTIPPVHETKVNGRLTFRPGENQNLRIPSVNILGGLVGQKTQEIILLSAHYDHLGVYEGALYPGANDNASGVGCILDVMRRILRESKIPKRTIALAFWSAEEMGFVGSQAFVHSAPFPLQRIKAVLNADTVGNGSLGNFAIWGDENNIAVKAIRQAAEICGVSVPITPTGGHNSDSFSFATAGIPALTLMAHEWLYKNHTPEDTVDLVQPAQVHLASEVIYQAVQILAF